MLPKLTLNLDTSEVLPLSPKTTREKVNETPSGPFIKLEELKQEHSPAVSDAKGILQESITLNEDTQSEESVLPV